MQKRILIKTDILRRFLKNPHPPFIKPEVSLTCSQNHVTGSTPEAVEPNPKLRIQLS
jgi:hypothetical protein